jgi:hypothetical protein
MVHEILSQKKKKKKRTSQKRPGRVAQGVGQVQAPTGGREGRSSQCRWLISVIPATWKVEIRRTEVGKGSLQDPNSQWEKAGHGGLHLSSQLWQEA